jgi:hypothetical protein
MNIPLQKIKSALYVFAWIFIVIIGWFLWFFARYYLVDVWSLFFPLTFGLGIGIISGLDPKRAFLACLVGFFIIALLIGFYFSIFEDLVFFGILCGLFAMAGAILRRILFRRGVEDLYMEPWQWIILIGGVTILADRLTILSTFQGLFVYCRISSFVRFFVPSLIGLFALGLYTGVFFTVEYDELMKAVKIVSLGAHGLFLVYMVLRYIINTVSWKPFLTASLMVLFFVVVYKGTQIGYNFRDRRE